MADWPCVSLARRLPLQRCSFISNKGSDMKSTRLLLAGSIAALLPLAGAFAQTPDAATQPSQPSQQGTTFESLDANSDGKISKAEAAANENVSAQFSKYDQNGDGFIERSEVNSANGSQSQPNPQ
jgi:hypothetical protein